MQGIVVPNAVIAPTEFFKRTRRITFPFVSNKSFVGLGASDTFSFLQTGIVAGVSVRLVGSVTTVHGTGTVATNARWPYDLVKKLRVSANGQSNLISCSGWKLKARWPAASSIRMVVPVMSAGIKSGVNWMRPKRRSRARAKARTRLVFPRPGTPSSRAWPPAIRLISTPRMASC